jgi:hypothetical protein
VEENVCPVLAAVERRAVSYVEMFAMNGDAPLEPRAERWLAEADEFGMMLMAEGTIVLPERAPEGANPYTCEPV